MTSSSPPANADPALRVPKGLARPVDLPRLSIVVPFYNAAKFLGRCLDSITGALGRLVPAEQGQVEVILCDNHSTDAWQAQFHPTQFPCPVRVVQPPAHLPNRTENWDFGLRLAQGEWMQMLHADDRLAPTGLQTIFRALDSKLGDEVVMLSGRIRFFSDDQPVGKLHPRWPFGGRTSGRALRQSVLPFHCPFVPFSVMRRETYWSSGGLNPAYELTQDYELWIRILAQGDVVWLSGELGHWRSHPFSEHYAELFAREHLLLAAALPRLIPDLPETASAAALSGAATRVRRLLGSERAEAVLQETMQSMSDHQRPETPQCRDLEARAMRRLHWMRLTGTIQEFCP